MTTTEPQPIDQTDKIAAQCNHCRRNLLLQAGADCPRLRIDLWLKIVVCNRCGDYLEKRRTIIESSQAICTSVGLAPKSAYEAARERAREPLIKLTQSFCHLLSKRWDTINDWSEEIVGMLLAQPMGATAALKAHERSHRRARETADAEVKQRLERGD